MIWTRDNTYVLAPTTDVICSTTIEIMSATGEIVSATIGNIIIADGKYSTEISAEPTETGIFTAENLVRSTHYIKIMLNPLLRSTTRFGILFMVSG